MGDLANTAIGWTGEFTDRDRERQFQDSIRSGNIAAAKLCILATTLTSLSFAPMDVMFLSGPKLFWFLTDRLIIALWCAVALFALNRWPACRTSRGSAALCHVHVLVFFALNALVFAHPALNRHGGAMFPMIVIGMMICLPGTFAEVALQSAYAAMVSLVFWGVLRSPPEPVLDLTLLAFLTVASYVIVGIWRTQLNRIRREEFLHVERERHINQTLTEAKDAAEAASRAKASFLAMMSHEIRTPMTGIISVAGLLMETPLTAAQRDWVRIITGSGESLLTILNDILDFSKLEQDKLELETAPFQLPKLLSDTVELMRNHAEAKDLNLRLTLEPSLEAWVEGDANRLRQILLNLIGNAVKFTDRGHVAVAARCLPQPAGYTLAEIEVEDTGIGMSEDIQARLFTPFTQADASISRRYGGTGLGLAISRRLAVAMGGGITVSSREAHGSRFTLALPLPKTVAPFCAPSLPGSGGLPPLHLLLVEDHRINAMVVQAILDKFGHSIELAVNGLEAIHAISSRPPGHFQAVLMDMQMPEMDGLEATRAIRRMKGPRSAVPIIAMTANAFSSDVEHCMQAGMNGYLSKPVDPAALFAELRRVLEMETA